MRRARDKGTREKNRIKKRELIEQNLATLTASDFLGPMAFLLLHVHDEGGQAPLSKIREKFILNWNERTFNRYLNRLESLLLIERKEDLLGFTDDLRRKIIRLTSLGFHVVSKFHEEFSKQPCQPLKRGPNLSKKIRELLKLASN